MINFILFLASVGVYLWILIHNALRRRAVIADAIKLPLPGCPSIHTGIEWAQWVPGKIYKFDVFKSYFWSCFSIATAFEGILFGWALYKTLRSSVIRWSSGARISLYEVILRDNLIYFFGYAVAYTTVYLMNRTPRIACILVFNNLMVLVRTLNIYSLLREI